jgi:hypothetical protein
MNTNSRTDSNNNIYTIAGVKHDGKTTVAVYLMEQLDKPSIIIDRTLQFSENTAYRVIVRGLNELRLYCLNPVYRKSFYKGKLQLIFRTATKERTKEIEKALQLINDNLSNITILFEEMELYADYYLNKNSPIFETLYLSRNNKFDIICVIKEISNLNKLVRNATDYFFLGRIKDPNAKKYFNTRSENQYKDYIKKIEIRKFLITDLTDYWKVFTLNQRVLKIIK